jgi:biopolymer transport protein ExbD
MEAAVVNQHAHAPDVMAEINITPFTDVLLVLLIVFMILTALATPPGFQRRFDRGPGIGASASVQPITVRIGSAGDVRIDDRWVRNGSIYETMAAAVQAHASRGLSTRIFLFAQASTRYDSIVRVLDAARQAGDDDVSFVVQ